MNSSLTILTNDKSIYSSQSIIGWPSGPTQKVGISQYLKLILLLSDLLGCEIK